MRIKNFNGEPSNQFDRRARLCGSVLIISKDINLIINMKESGCCIHPRIS